MNDDESEVYPEGSYSRAMQELGIAIDGLREAIMAEMLPALEPLVVALVDLHMWSIRRKYQVAWIAALLLLTLAIGVGQ